MIEGKTKEESIRLTAQALDCDELTARQIVEWETGEKTEGDVRVIQDQEP